MAFSEICLFPCTSANFNWHEPSPTNKTFHIFKKTNFEENFFFVHCACFVWKIVNEKVYNWLVFANISLSHITKKHLSEKKIFQKKKYISCWEICYSVLQVIDREINLHRYYIHRFSSWVLYFRSFFTQEDWISSWAPYNFVSYLFFLSRFCSRDSMLAIGYIFASGCRCYYTIKVYLDFN